MKVLLVAPPIMDSIDGRLQVVGVDAIRECPPLGIYTLAAVLEAHGHDVVVADLILHATRSLDAFAADVDAADLVGIGATSMAWPTAVDAIAQVRRRRPDVPIVCGGIHPTLFDRHVLRTFPVQFVVRGEGEVAIGRLCAALDGRSTSAPCRTSRGSTPTAGSCATPIDAKITAGDLAATPLPAGTACRRRLQVPGGRIVARVRLRLLVLQHAVSPSLARPRRGGGRGAPRARADAPGPDAAPAACTSSTTNSR